jgi:hypothetical protein
VGMLDVNVGMYFWNSFNPKYAPARTTITQQHKASTTRITIKRVLLFFMATSHCRKIVAFYYESARIYFENHPP